MLSCKTELTASMQKELNQKAKTVFILLLVIGSIGLLAYIVFGTVYENEPFWVKYFLASAIPFGIGLVFLITVNKLQKSFKNADIYNVYEFFDAYFTVNTFENGENKASAKVYYKDISKITSTKNYIFLYLQSKQALPVLKSPLSPEEQQFLLHLNK